METKASALEARTYASIVGGVYLLLIFLGSCALFIGWPGGVAAESRSNNCESDSIGSPASALVWALNP